MKKPSINKSVENIKEFTLFARKKSAIVIISFIVALLGNIIASIGILTDKYNIFEVKPKILVTVKATENYKLDNLEFKLKRIEIGLSKRSLIKLNINIETKEEIQVVNINANPDVQYKIRKEYNSNQIYQYLVDIHSKLDTNQKIEIILLASTKTKTTNNLIVNLKGFYGTDKEIESGTSGTF